MKYSRRNFLKTVLAGSMLFLKTPAFARGLPLNGMNEGNLLFYNTHTAERLKVTYREPSGLYIPEALKKINNILRCHYSGEIKDIDVNVIEFLNNIDKRLGGDNEVHIISGFRSTEYNRLLINKGRGVARGSLHLSGRAIDLNIPKYSCETLRKAALDLMTGGVGYYPKSCFIHIDSGRFRAW